jgi:hypothetical protein
MFIQIITIAEPDASQARIKGLLKLGYPNTGAVIKACFNVLKAFSQSLISPFKTYIFCQ